MSHQAAMSFARKVYNKNPNALAELQRLKVLAQSGDVHARNTLKRIAVCYKNAYGDSGNIFAGALPHIASTAGKAVRLVLTPAAWAVDTAGKGVRWVGSTLQRLSHVI